ncbi:unnamed protein product [Didymodactylos carnosus]|uniref:Uncharacterized protein n=1 Tax=Didymodactylos carnosus TaxID=1234261 RepID=A0A815DNQ9_9BILA|nr:unnamed protein product [Didymodactylos carnosus]CAF4119341.1 unnamed protein product [Didymodactylos carnosus]
MTLYLIADIVDEFTTEKCSNNMKYLFLMTANIKILKVDNFSSCNIFLNIDKITRHSIYQQYFNHINELNITEINDKNYQNLSIYMKFFQNIKILKLLFSSKLKSTMIYICIIPILRTSYLTLNYLEKEIGQMPKEILELQGYDTTVSLPQNNDDVFAIFNNDIKDLEEMKE